VDETALDGDWDVLVLTNPNNPDGRVIAPDRIKACAARLGADGGWVVVDEAFCDVMPEVSLAPGCHMKGLVVLRSFGKFFGLAGLRLGFVLAQPELAAEVRAAMGPWAFSGIAGDIAERALADGEWIRATRRRIGEDAARLDLALSAAGLEIIGGTALYRLARHEDAERIFRRLASRGILVRCFPDHPEWLRFGLPGDHEAMARLQRALAP